MKSPNSLSAPLAAVVVAAAGAAGPALAQEAGMVVTRDAETGQLRAPTADEMKALQAAAKSSNRSSGRTAAPAAEIVHANGAVELAVGEDTMVYSVARINAQGKVERACVQGLDASQKAMKAPVSFAARPQASRVAHAAPVARQAKETLDVK